MRTALVILLLVGPQSDEKQVDKAIKDFHSAWDKARTSDARIKALDAFASLRHDKILDLLIKKLEKEDASKVREALLASIKLYSDNEKAAKVLAEDAVAKLNAAWSKASESERVSLVTSLKMIRHDIVLDAIIKKVDKEKSPPVREAIFSAISEYVESEKAAKFLADSIDKNDNLPSVMQKIFQGLASLKPKYSRPYVDPVNKFVEKKGKGKDASYAVPAVNALGMIRHKSSIPVLINRLREAQKDMKAYIEGEGLPQCDGDWGITCTTVEQLLQQILALQGEQHAAWQVNTYFQIVYPLLNALKAITGIDGKGAKVYEDWWQKNEKKFEVIDK